MSTDLKILFISLGCDKNLVDSEEMLGLLNKENYTFTDDENEADIAIVNTCCFIGDAKEESIENILHLADLKNDGKLMGIVVTGCLAQRYKDEIIKEIPEVDAILGTTSYEDIVKAIDEIKNGNKYQRFDDLRNLPYVEDTRIVTTGGYSSYLKIAEGCNKRCTYCIIPSIRGDYRSVPMGKIVDAAKRLAAKGVKELILVAQETTVYGIDLYGKKALPLLLKKLCEIEGLFFIRLLYCYPEEITDELIEVMKEEKKICNYIDMPIQHFSDNILAKMGRKTTNEEITNLVYKLRKEIPDIVLRTTLITGFPGETDEDFEIMMDKVDELEFDRLGVFTYSPEEGTKACEMPLQIDEDVKAKRRDEVMLLQQEIAFENADKKIGNTYYVIIEGKLIEEGVYVGRTYMDAPSVDGNIFINTDIELMTGDIVKAKVIKASGYDLIGEMV